jgi:uncharacterized protein YndB with AHSA1/START domain/DNA-binding transcriptional ArsR family regulator
MGEYTVRVDARLLAALGEPNRLRIVELLSTAPRSVGEIASTLGLRQPQATKHLQTLDHVGLVVVYPLGQRRIYALRREPLRELLGWLGALGPDHPSEDVLEQYHRAIAAERERAQRDPTWAATRTFRLRRTLRGAAATLWGYWTSPELIRRWWSPEHFTVEACEADPIAGGILRIVMAEGDGTRHLATGHYLELEPPSKLSFELAPVGPDGAPLFSATHTVRLAERGEKTRLSLTVRVAGITRDAAPALAGLRLGWGQLLDKLIRELENR